MEIDFKKLDDKLNPSDVDFKVQTVISKGDKVYCILVAYKDARVDQRVLDDVVGKENWQVKYRRDENYEREVKVSKTESKVIMGKGVLFCSVGIKNVDEWIWKESNGTESFTESEKGEASDAFKRACFMWGIGRHLYDMPTIFITLEPSEYYKKGDQIKTNLRPQKWTFEISEDWGNIKAIDQTGKQRFTYNGSKK